MIECQRLVCLEQITLKLHRLDQQDEYWAAIAVIVDNLLSRETLEVEEVEDQDKAIVAVDDSHGTTRC